MAVEVAEAPGRLPLKPLFIYGKSGLGKTHLMRAIQNYIEETRPSMRTVYVDAQDFVSKYSEAGAIKDQEKVSFRNFRAYYEQADILLLDDVQHLQGKKESMNMLFQLFNTLTSQGKQVVPPPTALPKNIQFDERLKSRVSTAAAPSISSRRKWKPNSASSNPSPTNSAEARAWGNFTSPTTFKCTSPRTRVQHPRAQGRREYRHLPHDLLRSQRYLHR